MTKKVEPILVTAEESKITGDLGSRGIIPRPAIVENAIESPPVAEVCLACDEHHGSKGLEVACLKQEILRLRRKLRVNGFDPAAR